MKFSCRACGFRTPLLQPSPTALPRFTREAPWAAVVLKACENRTPYTMENAVVSHFCMPSDTIRRVRWLVHPSLSSAVGDALVRHGHQVVALDEPTLAAAKAKQLDVITADDSLVDEALAKGYNRSVVYLAVERGDVEQDDAVDRLFKRYKRLGPGRLYTVSASRVKVRQLPTKIAAE